MKPVIGIDLGGTEVKAMAFSGGGELLAQCGEPTRDGDTVDGMPAFVDSVRTCVQALEAEVGDCPLVGMCCPGLAKADGSAIAYMPGRLQGLENLNWREALERESLQVLNDAHAALLGEVWQGAARDCRNVFMLTLGTGVGGAIVADGELLRGHIGRAGHLGHLSVREDGPIDVTGIPGSLEETLSEVALQNRGGGQWKNFAACFAAAERGDTDAQEFIHQATRDFARGLAGLINVLDPERIVLGGGIAQAGEALFKPIREALEAWEWRPGGHTVEIVQAALGARAGAYGAAWNVLHQQT